MAKKIIFILFLLITNNGIYSQNPIIGNIGISDPHIRVFNDTIYLFSGHDSSPEDRTWTMRDWRVYQTCDLVNWQQINTISPKDNFMGESTIDCWAGDAAQRNGKYYFYFSDRKRGIGVMGADSVTGHFKDLLGRYLVSPMHDPTIFYEDNMEQTPYMIYGSKDQQYHIVRLGEDMISVDEKPRPIIINGAEWEQEPGWLDKNYFFKQNDTYYLSWGSGYATSKNIYGPYECQGYFGEGHHLGNLAHSSFFWWKGQFYHIWCYYIRKGYRYRSTIISYCHVGDDGKISTDTKFLDAHFSHGVARYDSSWDRVEAEWYYEISDNSHKRGTISEGFYTLLKGKNSFVRFSNFNFEKATNTMTINLSNSHDTEIEVREGGLGGRLLGSLKVKGNSKRVCANFDVNIDKGRHDLYIINKGDSTLNIDWFKFN